ncbi:MAG: ABC transporter permease, partial [Bacteroidota bacterium]
MNKIFILFKREYKAAVKTKSFIISLVLLPIIMSGGLIVVILNEEKIDTEEKKVVIIDHSGLLEEPIKQSIDLRNSKHIFDPQTNKQIQPFYYVEFHDADSANSFKQQLKLSERVRSKEIHAFIEIGPGILKPNESPETAYLKYYSEHSFNDEVRNWLNNNINNLLREIRAEEINLDPSVSQNLFAWSNMETMGLVNVDKKTGEEKAAERSDPFQSFIIPYIFLLLMFMLTMMSAAPL